MLSDLVLISFSRARSTKNLKITPQLNHKCRYCKSGKFKVVYYRSFRQLRKYRYLKKNLTLSITRKNSLNICHSRRLPQNTVNHLSWKQSSNTLINNENNLIGNTGCSRIYDPILKLYRQQTGKDSTKAIIFSERS